MCYLNNVRVRCYSLFDKGSPGSRNLHQQIPSCSLLVWFCLLNSWAVAYPRKLAFILLRPRYGLWTRSENICSISWPYPISTGQTRYNTCKCGVTLSDTFLSDVPIYCFVSFLFHSTPCKWNICSWNNVIKILEINLSEPELFFFNFSTPCI